jgi:hypothetical protein
MAAWKETPKYKAQLLDASTGSSIATSSVYTAAPNVNGNASGNVSSAVSRDLKATVTKAGNYVIKFSDETTSGGYHEFLLLACTLKQDNTSGVDVVRTDHGTSGFWSLTGAKLDRITKGINIVRMPDGTVKKVLVK